MKKIIVLVIIILCLISISCSEGDTSQEKDNKKSLEDNLREKSNNSSDKSKEEVENQEKIDPIIEQINKMNLDQKIGQIVITGFEGYSIDDNVEELIVKYKIGGFILYDRNVKNTDQLLELVNSFKAINKNNIPLLLSIDEEGGRVTRLPPNISKLPNSKDIGKLNNEKAAYEFGKTIGLTLKSFGIDMNFAPVMDINNNPNNTVIGDRSFGDNPKIVSRMGINVMKGISSKGIIPVIKHFPGHGDTSIDSHVALPVIEKDLDRIIDFELKPFINAIHNNTDCIMTAHILLTQIDNKNPASLSPVIISDILRVKLGFEGVVITDDLTMGAILNNYNNIGEAAIHAVNAGNDIVLVAHEYDNTKLVLKTLKQAVKTGKITEKRLNTSIYRILKLKNKYKVNNNIINKKVNLEVINTEIKNINNYFY